MSVRDFMTKNVITVHSAMPIFDAIDLMKKHDIHRLPVVDQQRLQKARLQKQCLQKRQV